MWIFWSCIHTNYVTALYVQISGSFIPDTTEVGNFLLKNSPLKFLRQYVFLEMHFRVFAFLISLLVLAPNTFHRQMRHQTHQNQILETFLQKPLAGITAPNECVLALYVSWPSSSPWPLPQTAPLTRSSRLLLRRSAVWYSASVPSSFVLLSPLPASVVSLRDTVGREKTHTVTRFDVQIYMTDTQFRVLNMHVWMCVCIYKRVSQMSSPRNYLHWQFFN